MENHAARELPRLAIVKEQVSAQTYDALDKGCLVKVAARHPKGTHRFWVELLAAVGDGWQARVDNSTGLPTMNYGDRVFIRKSNILEVWINSDNSGGA